MQASTKFITETDPYKGMHVRFTGIVEAQQFQSFIDKQESDVEKLKAIWVYLDTSHLSLLDLLVNRKKYTIHHGLGKQIVVYKWLREEQDLVVPYSIFWSAAGALVIKDNKVLLVEEKSGKRKGKYGLPGGRANRGELIAQCAQRQLFEETGIKAKFERIVFFRELTKQVYNCVDTYYICLMTLDESSLSAFKLCQRQISNYKWVDLDQYDQFCKHNSIGSQLLVSKHVTKLYKEGSLFKNGHCQTSLNIQKGLCEHRL